MVTAQRASSSIPSPIKSSRSKKRWTADTGSSNNCRPVEDGDDLVSAERVGVNLAGGQRASAVQFDDGEVGIDGDPLLSVGGNEMVKFGNDRLTTELLNELQVFLILHYTALPVDQF